MSLTSYRAAPPRVTNITSRFSSGLALWYFEVDPCVRNTNDRQANGLTVECVFVMKGCSFRYYKPL